jgi:hypothetical protein
MKKRFGYMIPVKRLDKSFKACYRYSNYDSCLHDSSYFEYIVISSENVPNVFNLICKDINIGREILSDQNVYKIDVYDLLTGDNPRLIGPVIFIQMGKCLMLKFHPLMKKELFQLFEILKGKHNLDIGFINKGLNTYTLLGPLIPEKIFGIFKSLNWNINHNIDYFCNKLLNLKESECILFDIDTPNVNFKLNELVYNFIKDKQSDDIVMKASDSVNENFINDYLLSCKADLIKNNEQSEINDFEIPTERTLFVHRKKIDAKKINLNNDNLIRALKYTKLKEPILQIKKETKNESNDNDVIMKEAETKRTFAILIKENVICGNLNKPKYTLIFPRGYSNSLLRRFSYSNTKILGLKEVNYYLTDNLSPVFPQDYPSTHSYLQYIRSKAIHLIQKYCRYPAGKRTNYQKNCVSSPFYPNWAKLNKNYSTFLQFNKNIYTLPTLSNNHILQMHMSLFKNKENINFLIPINFVMIEKGIPHYNSIIYFPTEEDIKSYLSGFLLPHDTNPQLADFLKLVKRKENFKLKQPVINTVIKNKVFNTEFKTIIEKKFDLNYNSDILSTDLTIKALDNPIRQEIGYVTSGHYSYQISKGIGKGFINVKLYKELIIAKKNLKLSETFILVRDKDSVMYYLAKLLI